MAEQTNCKNIYSALGTPTEGGDTLANTSAHCGTLVLCAKGMSLTQTLQCGQTFSWQQTGEDEFMGVAGSRAVFVRQQNDTIIIKPADSRMFSQEDETFWAHYFALDFNYDTLLKNFCTDDRLAKCVQAASGIRVLRQPFWDTLISFIISQNNNIKRIEKIVRALCRTLGQKLAENLYAFPTPQVLAQQSEDALKALGAGYRASYLIAAGKNAAEGRISEQELQATRTEDARRTLLTIHGVGPKVADCVLLFGLERTEVAPMDVWMKRAMSQIFGGNMPTCARGYEGIAQQYIFHWARQNI